MKSKREEGRQADDRGPAATAKVEALLSLATEEALSQPGSSRRARAVADLAKLAMELGAMEELDQRIAALEDVLPQRRSGQTTSGRHVRGLRRGYGHSSRSTVMDSAHWVRRVDGLHARLDARERAMLALKSMKSDELEDPTVRSTMPPEQVDAFNRLIGLIRGVNQGLGPLAFLVRQEVETTALRLALLQMIRLQQRIGDDRLVTVTSFPRRNAQKTERRSIKESIKSHWAKVRAIQEVIQDIAEEFDGEDPARPELRGLLDDTTEQLQELHEESKKLVGNYRLPKPRDEQKSLMRELVGSWGSP